MSLLDRLLGVIAPHECLGCGAEGSLLCAECRLNLRPAAACCYRCQRWSEGGRTCSRCRQLSPLGNVYAAAHYSGPAKKAVARLKFYGAQAAARIMAERMFATLAATATSNSKPLIIPVPTATGRVRQRGYDQAILLARELSRLSDLPWLACLSRRGQRDQIGASRQKRFAQLSPETFRVTLPAVALPAHVILVDDVITTGATIEAAARSLRQVGVKRLDAVAFARP